MESDAEVCDGAWEPCCEDGVVTTCCCPDGAECNYGMFATCDDGSCTLDPSECDKPTPDAEVLPDTTTPTEDAGPEADAGAEECDGTWNQCCIDGEISQCCCPEGAICNYWYEACPDGGCTFPGEPCAKPEPECDGAWEACCVEGVIEQCCCPEGMACNYGDFNDCGDNTCVAPSFETCEPPEPECDGTWNQCCIDGEISQCCCPEGAICNYWYEPCPDGGCTFPGEPCTEPEPECDGTWQTCCVDGVVDQCCCPDGMACNYGMFMTCDDGSCVGPAGECKESQ